MPEHLDPDLSEIFAFHLDGLVIALTGFEVCLGKAVLAKGTGLEQYGSALYRIGIYQRYADLVGADPVNQSRDVFGQPRAVALRVKIAQVGLQHAAVVYGRWRAHGHLNEGFGQHWIEFLEVVAFARFRVAVIAFQTLQAAADAGIGRVEDLVEVVGIFAFGKGEPGFWGADAGLGSTPVGWQTRKALASREDLVETGQILGALAQVIQVDVQMGIGWAEVEPAAVAVPCWHLDLTVLLASVFPEHIEL